MRTIVTPTALSEEIRKTRADIFKGDIIMFLEGFHGNGVASERLGVVDCAISLHPSFWSNGPQTLSTLGGDSCTQASVAEIGWLRILLISIFQTFEALRYTSSQQCALSHSMSTSASSTGISLLPEYLSVNRYPRKSRAHYSMIRVRRDVLRGGFYPRAFCRKRQLRARLRTSSSTPMLINTGRVLGWSHW